MGAHESSYAIGRRCKGTISDRSQVLLTFEVVLCDIIDSQLVYGSRALSGDQLVPRYIIYLNLQNDSYTLRDEQPGRAAESFSQDIAPCTAT